MGVILLVMFTPKVMLIKMSKIPHFMYLLLYTASISLGKIFECIYHLSIVKFYLSLLQNTIDYVVLIPFTKYYRLRSSEPPLAKFQHLKIQDFGISLLTQQFLNI